MEKYIEDFNFFIQILKSDHPYNNLINFSDLNFDYKNIKDENSFIYFMKYIEKKLSNQEIGHFSIYPNTEIIKNSFLNSLYMEIKKIIKTSKNFEEYNLSNNIFRQPKKYLEIKEISSDSLLIILRSCEQKYINDTIEKAEELKYNEKIHPHKNIYFDLRDNLGGHPIIWEILLSIFYNKKVQQKTVDYVKITETNKNQIMDLINIYKSTAKKITKNIYKIETKTIYDLKKINKQIYNKYNISIIINNKTFSAAECFVQYAKISKFKIYGDENSGGCGIGIKDQLYYVLPNSKLLFCFESCFNHEKLKGTKPNHKLGELKNLKNI